MYRPKDFIETREGLVFAVLDGKPEKGRVLCFLRYQRGATGWQKLTTQQANQRLIQYYPQYRVYSERFQAQTHAVPETDIVQHHHPRRRLAQICLQSKGDDIEQALHAFSLLLRRQGVNLEHVGVTGSLLIGAQREQSDIDLVFYDRKTFQQVRRIVAGLIAQGLCQHLNQQDWAEAWQRRDCDLSLPDYIAAEQRKHNKVMFRQYKIDLSLLAEDAPVIEAGYEKCGAICVKLQIKNADYSFDYPAVYATEDAVIRQIVCFTATYLGQALAGEWVEVSGQLECSGTGQQRIIVGSSREARGEYIKRVSPL